MTEPTVRTFDDADALVAAAADDLVAVIERAQAERGFASIVLTGGTNGNALSAALREKGYRVATHDVTRDLPALLRAGDVLVFNDTRVIPAQLEGRRGEAASNPGRYEHYRPPRYRPQSEDTAVETNFRDDFAEPAEPRPIRKHRYKD